MQQLVREPIVRIDIGIFSLLYGEVKAVACVQSRADAAIGEGNDRDEIVTRMWNVSVEGAGTDWTLTELSALKEWEGATTCVEP